MDFLQCVVNFGLLERGKSVDLSEGSGTIVSALFTDFGRQILDSRIRFALLQCVMMLFNLSDHEPGTNVDLSEEAGNHGFGFCSQFWNDGYWTAALDGFSTMCSASLHAFGI